MQTFLFHSDCYYGEGALQGLGKVKSKRALIITDPQMADLGFAEKVAAELRAAGAAVRTFAEVEPDPSTTTCEKGAQMAREFEPDTVIGLGGGSAMDAAKAVWALYETPDATWDELFAKYASHPTRKEGLIQFVAIPSTSGTGSEMSRAGVITDRRVTPNVKQLVFSGRPHISIVDPIFPATMPPSVTANTGLDAFVHAWEAVISNGKTDIITAVGIRAIEKVMQWLPVAVEDGKNMKARDEMHTASMMAGMCMMAGHSLTHSTAHQLGSVFGIPHGKANAIMQPYVMEFNAEVASKELADIAWHLGIRESNDRASTAALIDYVIKFQRKLGIPASIKDTGVDEAKFMSVLPAMAANAIADGSTAGNPAPSTVKDAETLFLKAWRGDAIAL